MKLRHFRNHPTTFNICMAYIHNPSKRNARRLRLTLNRWARSNTFYGDRLADYGYEGDLHDHLGYCSDRMNQGRAKALLRLLDAKEGKK